MPTKRIEAVVDGRRIAGVNTWFAGEWIEVDGVVVAKARTLFSVSTEEPLVAAVVVGASGRALHVELFLSWIVTLKMVLVVDGVRVAGDEIVSAEEAAAARARARLAASASATVGAPVAVPLARR